MDFVPINNTDIDLDTDISALYLKSQNDNSRKSKVAIVALFFCDNRKWVLF